MGFSDEVFDILLAETTRSPHPFQTTTAMFIDRWSKGDYVISLEPTVDCSRAEYTEVMNVFLKVLLMMVGNVDCVGWRPHEFHRICNKVNLILDGRGLVSVAQKWAFSNDDEWIDAQLCVKKNIINAVRGTIFE